MSEQAHSQIAHFSLPKAAWEVILGLAKAENRSKSNMIYVLITEALEARGELPAVTADNDTGVYFAQSADGPIKIGFSRNIGGRIRALQTASASTITLLATLAADNESIERNLHKRFSNDRLNGEWFKPSPQLLEFIDTLKNHNNLEQDT